MAPLTSLTVEAFGRQRIKRVGPAVEREEERDNR
jgi:hypothetical protein